MFEDPQSPVNLSRLSSWSEADHSFPDSENEYGDS